MFFLFHVSCSLLSELRSVLGSLRLSDWFNRPGIIEVGDNFDSLTRGHATQPEELTDINFDREVMKHFQLVNLFGLLFVRTLACLVDFFVLF